MKISTYTSVKTKSAFLFILSDPETYSSRGSAASPMVITLLLADLAVSILRGVPHDPHVDS